MPNSLRIWPGSPSPQGSPAAHQHAGSAAMLAPAGRAPRQRGTLSALKARLLPGSSETEFSTPFGARKHAGKPVSAAAAYTPPAPATESTLRPATAGEQARAARSQAATAALVQRTQHGLQRLRGTDPSPTAPAAAPDTRQPVTVPTSTEQYRRLLAQRFAATRDTGAVDHLSARLAALAPPAAAAAGEPHQYARPMLVAEALARTCGHDAAAALRVLASLASETRLDAAAFAWPKHTAQAPASPARSSASSASSDTGLDTVTMPAESDAPDGPPPSPSALASAEPEVFFDALETLSAPEDAGAAWRTAQLLARSHGGLEALCDLMRLPQVPAHRHAAHAFLQAADRLQRGAAGPAASPQALLQRHPPGSGRPEDSLAIKTLHAAAAQLRGDALDPGQVGTLFAWRQGFREEGPGSDLAKVKARTAKFVNRTIRRVEHHGWRTTLWQTIGKKKSPLSVARLGMQAAHREGLAKEYATYGKSLRTAVQALKDHYRHALAAPPAALRVPLPWHSADAMWQSAILMHWASLPLGAPLSAYTLTHDTLQSIGNALRATVMRVREELTLGFAQVGLEIAAAQQEIDQAANAGGKAGARQQAQLTALQVRQKHLVERLQRLVEFGGQAGLHLGAHNQPTMPPAHLIGVYPDGAMLRAWSQPVAVDAASGPLGKALDTAEHIERQDDLKLREASIDAARTVIESLMTTIESSSKLRLASGATLGVNTGAISTGVQKAGQTLAVPVAVQVDAHASRKRQAVVEIARGSHGRDLFIGTDKTVHAAAGFGASIGYDFKVLKNRIRALVGASVVPIDAEKGERVGVMYRAVRQVTQAPAPYADWDAVKYDDATTREAMIALSNWLFQQATEHRDKPAGADDAWNALARHCSDSVGVRLTGEITSRDTTAMRETTGIMRSEQYSQGYGGHMTVRAGLNYSVGKQFYTSSAQDSAAAHPTASAPAGERRSITQGFNGGTPLAYSRQFAERSHTAKLKTVHLDGQLADRVCYSDKEYKSAKEYLALIRSAQDTWVDMLSRKPGGTVDKARKEFEDYCATVERHTGPHIVYVVRERLRPAAAREIEGHLDLANLHRATGTTSSDTPPAASDRSETPRASAGPGAAPQTAMPRPPAPLRKTSRLPALLRNQVDKVTARSEKAAVKTLSDTQLGMLTGNPNLSGRMTRAVQREAAKRLDAPSAQARAMADAAADAQACEARADAALFAETSWLPDKLAIMETVSKRESRGLSLTVQMQSTSEASGQRELHHLKFS
ncbi:MULTISPECIES: hypothetical protein [Ralstonia solanacearum species complex]|nr:hypothetical protein [Ralstonia solanacearum]KEI33397.1 AWR family protein [Ralstonia solanacearum]KFX77657.1 AWR family protein [Ralstonia solanacearum]KLT21068.1 AWR family protein [Ralstonia solanacearum]MDN4063660.1 hypothetical protein [Ralstonia solanacearum]NUU71095.1 hypothetical protein [Ralstonia solanacearum]